MGNKNDYDLMNFMKSTQNIDLRTSNTVIICSLGLQLVGNVLSIFLWELHRSLGFAVAPTHAGGALRKPVARPFLKLQPLTGQCCQFPNICDHLITFEWLEEKKKERRERRRWAFKWASVHTASKHTHQRNPHPEYLFKENLGPRRDHCQIYQTSYVLRAIYLCKTREEIG